MKKAKWFQQRVLLTIAVSLMAFVFVACSTGGKEQIDEEAVKTNKTLTQKHKKFITDFYPAAAEANKNIMADRAMLLKRRKNYHHTMNHSSLLEKLNTVAERYRFGNAFFTPEMSKQEFKSHIDSMLYYVDYIPEKLVMAQAVIESGWGTSKFAREINNYYGIRCYRPGCGRDAAGVENPSFWVKAYPNIEACISEYLWTLNTGRAYEGLRETRKELRESGQYPNAIMLAQGLEKYSEKGSEYIRLIEAIINDYLPPNLAAYLEYTSVAKESQGS
jgi:Bax protein